MPSEWINRCGVRAYRFHESGAIEVEGLDFPAWAADSAMGRKIAQIWADWGETATKAAKEKGMPPAWIIAVINIESGGNPKAGAPCEPVYCPALWNKGACASQGGPETLCAGGLMAFISQTAARYGHTMQYYIENPHEMVYAGADLFKTLVDKNNGDACAAAKMYNGGGVCGGGGLVGMGGQGDYVSKFIQSANTFVNLGLAPKAGIGDAGQGLMLLVAFGVLGYAAYWWLDQEYRLTKRVREAL